ncbi:DUF2817 domain-containing protein [Kamptonema cortianum]|nr:DUF2817 domain-containing protein [Oscillatoria laete-virens]MDK3157160.1 DUF2817 domain-containing protein [Kamptonema cortianum]MDL5051136.1 DUF2817 domain-containing protein [Oscillatoria amoena NRMC-F 0135]MDL5055042.1 DUF2817 domain-containing protein [Oscillatoria laete-virens NRMC-F 0139]
MPPSFTPAFLKVIEEELLVGVEAAAGADQPWIMRARLDEVLRVCVRCTLKDHEAFAPVLRKVIHPLIRVYSDLLAVTDNDPLVWGNLQLSLRLLRDERNDLKKPHRYRSARELTERFRGLCHLRNDLCRVNVIGHIPTASEGFDLLHIQLASTNGDPGEKIQVAITSGLHGDEAEGIYAVYRWINEIHHRPGLLNFYTFHLYPIVNPHGFEYATRENGNGVDLNREFGGAAREPEAIALQRELQARRIDGLINLHADDDSEGLYGYANGPLLSEALVKPALRSASMIIPINQSPLIDGHRAEAGIIKESVAGALRPLSIHSRSGHEPFDITLETPNLLSLVSRATAHVIMLRTLVDEHRKFISQAADL